MPKIIEFEEDPGLEKLQEAVGGYIEIVPYFREYKGRMCNAVCDEEGKLKGKPLNMQATNAWRHQVFVNYVLVGDIAIVYGGVK